MIRGNCPLCQDAQPGSCNVLQKVNEPSSRRGQRRNRRPVFRWPQETLCENFYVSDHVTLAKVPQ